MTICGPSSNTCLKNLPEFMLALRSTLFYLGLTLNTLFFGLLSPLAWALPRRQAYNFMVCWNRCTLVWVRLCCGIRYQVHGLENVPPAGPYVVMANHQSAFETILMAILFPQPAFVLKRSLLHIPFFGWGLAATRPIAVNHKAPIRSFKNLVKKAGKKLQKGDVIIIYPEGARLPTGVRAPYQPGSAHIATHNGVPVVPVAHNAGHCWPRRFLKYPGTVTLTIGAPIDATGMDMKELNQKVQEWIEAQGAQMAPPA